MPEYIVVPAQLLLLLEELALLNQRQENLLRYLREVSEDGITYEECGREAEAISRACLELLQEIKHLSQGVTTIN